MNATADALRALSGPTWPVTEAAAHVPSKPGLYAIYGDEQAWRDLGQAPRTEHALYVGKSQGSLASREMGDHFAVLPGQAARTRKSTVRRSLAAILRHQLKLSALPRTPSNPESPSLYSLSEGGDLRLTLWMHERLRLAAWTKRVQLSTRELKTIEKAVIELWSPRLNLDHNPQPWTHLRVERKAMANEVRAWMSARAESSRTKPAPASPNPGPTPTPRTNHPTPTTPPQLADELGIDEKRLRAQLRRHYDGPGKGGRWSLTPEQVDHMRKLFG